MTDYMKKNIISFLTILVFLSNAVVAQVDIKISILPPYPSKVTDYASRPQQVLLMVRNLGRTPLDIQLRGTITGDNGISLRVDPRYKSPSPLRLQGSETRNLNGTDISELFDYNQLTFSGISKENVIRANGLPEGNYQICVQAFDYATGQPLSNGEPLGCSNVFPLTSVEPPVILSPINDQAVSSLTTQNFVISWTTPPGAPPSTQYTINMVEILDGKNPNDAVNTSTQPPFFRQTVNASNLLLYGPAMPALTPGRRYALAVTARDPFNSVTFRNRGRSEVTSFVYGDTADARSMGSPTATTGNKGDLPTLTIKGRLTWYYRRSEQTPLMAKSKYEPSHYGMASMTSQAALLVDAVMKDPTFVAGVKPAQEILAVSYKPVPGPASPAPPEASIMRMAMTVNMNALKAAAPTAPIVPSSTKQVYAKAPTAVAVMGGGIVGLINSNDPSLFDNYGPEAHPLAGTIIKLLATDTTVANAAPQLAGAGVTDEQGNFQLSFVPPTAYGTGKGFRYTLGIQEGYFELPPYNFSLPDNSGTTDLGEIKALANTYRLLPFSVATSDSELVSGIIDVYRRADFYTSNPQLRTEGNIDPSNRITETIGGQQYIKVSSIKDGYTGTRLFYSTGNADQYKVKVSVQNFSTCNTSLSVAASTNRPTAPQTVHQVYKLAPGPTTFSGTVSGILGQSGVKRPLAGATVTLYLTEEAYQESLRSGSNGLIMGASKVVTGTLVNAVASKMATPAGGTPRETGNPAVHEAKGTVNHLNAPVVQPVNVPAGHPANTAGLPGNGTKMVGLMAPINGPGVSATNISPSQLVQGLMTYLNTGKMTATTDSTGGFTFSSFPVNPAYMKFVVSVPGSSVSKTDSVLIDTKGAHVTKTVDFTFVSYAVTGRIVDEQSNPIPHALFTWASGGSYGQADANGYFATTNKAGTDTLIVKKLGYQDRRIGITIKGSLSASSDAPAVSGSDGIKPIYTGITMTGTVTMADKYIGMLATTGTYKQAAAQGTPISPAGFGFTSMDISGTALAKVNLPNWVGSMVQPFDNPSGAVDLGKIILKKRIGRMLITVQDATGKALNKAGIRIDGTDSTEYTGSDGTRYIQGPGGNLLLNISGPDGTTYAPQQVALTVNDQDTARKTVRLAQGVRISGHVTSAGSPVAGADVGVQGLDYIHTTSDNAGAYSLIVAKDTSYTLRAARSGYVSATQSRTFAANATLDFTLSKAGFDITKLLGFPVQIDKIEDMPGGHKKLSGSFVNIPGNPLFSIKAGTVIPFTGQEVEIRNNIPVPVSGNIVTDLTQLSLKAFGFLPVKLTNNGDALIVSLSGGTGDAGEVKGLAAIDYGAFMPAGIAPYVDAAAKQYVRQTASSTPQSTVVLNSSGSLTGSSLFIGGQSGQRFSLYGFSVTLDLAGSTLKADGLHLKGNLDLSSIPLLSNTQLQVKDLWVGANGYISGVDVNMDPAPTFSIAGWGATLTGLSFNDNGFTVSGNIRIQVPGSQPSRVDFANLNIAADQLYGGSFTIPSSGIDVFGIVKFMGGPAPLSFGKVGASNVYYVGGSGTVKFSSLFNDMTLKFFQVQTNGQFAATIPANINQDFWGLAKVTITEIGFHTNNGVGVDIQGDFLLKAIPFIKAQVGGVHFGTGGSVSVDNIGLSFDLVGIAAVKASIAFENTPEKKGFAGSGAITIIGLTGVEINFSYYKVPNGISVSAFFKANITIPVGVVSISNPGGGFSLNTGDGSWSVTIRGDASIASLGTAVAITNISVTVSNGPVIKGTAGLSVLTVNVANASLLLDIPKSLFTVEINAGLNLIPKVVSAEGSSIFTLSAARNDTYFFIGTQFHATLLGIFNTNANLAAGWGLNVGRHPELSEYTSFIDPIFLDNGMVKGVYLQAISDIGFRASGDIFIASGSIWYKNTGVAKINMGFGSGNYGLDIGASWDCGASLSIWPFGQIGSVDIGTDASIRMDYINGCFRAGARLAAHLVASIGNCDDDCFTGLCMHHLGPFKIIPEGGKICVHPGLKVGYDCNSGFSFGIDL
jgi:TANFOR domain-containing protein